MENICDTISIFDAASKFGVALKGKGKLYCSPFRKDEHPSFSIFGNGKLFKDLATGETGNVISFTAKLKGISNKEAYKLLLSEFDNGSFKAVSSGRHSLDRNEEKKPRKGDINAPKKLLWDDALAEIVAKRYSVSVESLKHAFDAGCFGFGNSNKTGNVWIVSDNRKLSYQIRRMDGNNWKFSGKEAKAWTLKNSDCSYPIGLENAKDKQAICICEGSTDFLSCFHILKTLNMLGTHAPVAMLGANHKIGIPYLREFAGKVAMIFADADEAGHKAGMAWANQLKDIAAVAMICMLPDYALKSGKKIKDLNDYLRYSHEQGKELNPFRM